MVKHYGRICEHCGARLDPGERCDCREARKLEKTGRSEIKTKSAREGTK